MIPRSTKVEVVHETTEQITATVIKERMNFRVQRITTNSETITEIITEERVEGQRRSTIS